MHMADLVVAYPDMSSKRAHASRAVWAHLYSECEQPKIDGYLNNERIRMAIIPSLVDHLAFGATGGLRQ